MRQYRFFAKMTLHYPLIDPVLVRIGPLEVRWYGLMYLVGFALGYLVIRSELKRKQGAVPVEAADDLLFYLIIGLLVGGRVGYVLFYNLEEYIYAPWEVFALWHGGMSFHGGLIGMLVSGYIFARKRKADFLDLADIGALAAPLGLMLGRIGNLINGELYGRITSVPWGIVFPTGGPLPQASVSTLRGPIRGSYPIPNSVVSKDPTQDAGRTARSLSLGIRRLPLHYRILS